MAGDWIKITHGLHGKPEVFGIARSLSVTTDHAVGLLIRFWTWADMNTVDGHVDHMLSTDVDRVVDHVGFGNALIDVGWIVQTGGAGFDIKSFGKHNGESAKKRANKNNAQAKWRSGLVDTNVDKDVDQTQSTKASTREEKRREEKSKHIPPTEGSAAPADADAAAGIRKVLFDTAVELMDCVPEKSVRSLVGQSLKKLDDEQVLAVLEAMRGAKPVEPVSWFNAAVNSRANKNPKVTPATSPRMVGGINMNGANVL